MNATYRQGRSVYQQQRAAFSCRVSLLLLPILIALGGHAYAGQDSDGIPDNADNCILIPNPDQRDTDDDGVGNACDPDFNNDGIINAQDRSLLYNAFYTSAVLNDLNGDGYVNVADLGRLYSRYNQPPGPTGRQPHITVTSPADGQITAEPDVTLTGRLNFRAALTINNAPVPLNPDKTFSYLAPLQPGPNAFQLTATSVTGATTQQGLSVTYEPAVVTINAALITLGPVINGQITITGQAGSVPAGTQVTITNFDTGATVTVTANSDGSFSATLAAHDGHALGITATDATGGGASDTISKPVGNILNLAITAPINGDVLNSDRVTVSGSFNGRANVGIAVNGVAACIVGTGFYANNVPVVAGQAAIEVTGAIADGVTVSETITVTGSAATGIRTEVAPACGLAPLDVSFAVADVAGSGIQKIDVDFDNNGTIDYSSTDPAAPIANIYPAAGIYEASVTVTDAVGAVHQSNHYVAAGTVTDMDAMLRGIYNGMLARLRIGAIDGALNVLNGDVRAKYRNVFESLGQSLATVVDQLGTIVDGTIYPEFAQYIIVQDNNGEQRAYFLEFLRGEDGVWRIAGM